MDTADVASFKTQSAERLMPIAALNSLTFQPPLDKNNNFILLSGPLQAAFMPCIAHHWPCLTSIKARTGT